MAAVYRVIAYMPVVLPSPWPCSCGPSCTTCGWLPERPAAGPRRRSPPNWLVHPRALFAMVLPTCGPSSVTGRCFPHRNHNINAEVFEASLVDGANGWQQLWYDHPRSPVFTGCLSLVLGWSAPRWNRWRSSKAPAAWRPPSPGVYPTARPLSMATCAWAMPPPSRSSWD